MSEWSPAKDAYTVLQSTKDVLKLHAHTVSADVVAEVMACMAVVEVRLGESNTEALCEATAQLREAVYAMLTQLRPSVPV